MSLKKHIRFQSLMSLKEKENLSYISYKKSLNDLWKQFMSAFGYKKYYNTSKNNNNIISYDVINNNNEGDLSIKLFLDFLEENSIEINNDNLLANNKIGVDILSEAKIWIMFIIYVHDKLRVNNNIVMNIFKEGIKNGADVISLFEFFLIYISNIKEKHFGEFYNKENIEEILPKEFIVIYYQKKNILRNIFQKDEYEYEISNNFNMRNSLKKFLANDTINPTTFILSEEKEKNQKIHLDIKDIIIISKDYLNKGYFIIFKDRKDSEENKQDTFINYDFIEDEDDNYCLMPLLIKYKNYDQKLDANNTLNLINKSIYKNYTYYPHDINIINKL